MTSRAQAAAGRRAMCSQERLAWIAAVLVLASLSVVACSVAFWASALSLWLILVGVPS